MQLDHSPSEILQKLLIQAGLATLPLVETTTTWPAYITNKPSRPDACIILTDTPPKMDGRIAFDGEVMQHEGIQIMVRATTHQLGWAKINAIAGAFDEDVYLETVHVDNTNYVVHAIKRANGPLPLGKEPESTRLLFTLNVLATIYQE
jgi:hypothetical protein